MANRNIKSIKLNPEARQVLTLLETAEQPVFLTGRAGTGKSTLLRHFRKTTRRKPVVLAPTGVAAVNIGGQTIHSFFGFPLGITPNKAKALKPKDRQLYQKLSCVVIDEISMVRADLLDCVDAFLRVHGPHRGLPFGGVQMVMVGDLLQLPPVVPPEEATIFRTYYASPYFFDANVFQDMPLQTVELTTVYRQSDPAFVALLDDLRQGFLSPNQLKVLNQHCSAKALPASGIQPIHLVTTNAMAQQLNDRQLAALTARAVTFRGDLTGAFSESQTPTSRELILKKGARIMMLNNDRHGHWVNGDVGRLVGMRPRQDDAAITVLLDNGHRGIVEKHRWELVRFVYDETLGSIESRVIGSFTQYPVRLAWASTIHKAQGKTFDHVVVDFGRRTFAPGQAYVALSRCTSLEGLHLTTPIEARHVFLDPHVQAFLRRQRPP